MSVLVSLINFYWILQGSNYNIVYVTRVIPNHNAPINCYTYNTHIHS